ncbi:MAG: O-antigen ligase family protein [Granulosicoccaceae bacterium]
MSLSTYQTPYRVSLVAIILLCVVVVHGTSTSLTLAYHFNYLSGALEPMVNLIWGVCYIVAFIGLMANYGINWISWVVRYRLLLTILIFGTLFSAVWSIDTGLTLERNAHLIGSTTIALYLGFTIPLERLLKVTSIVLGLLMLASVTAVFAYPQLGIENYEGTNVWRGVMTSKNTLGFWATVSAMLFITQLDKPNNLGNRALIASAALLSIVVLVYSVSATSVLALIVGLLVMGYLYVAFRFELGFVAMTVLGLLSMCFAAAAFLNIDTAELIGRSGDLTGRGAVWQQTWKLILQKPFTGYGYGTIWQPTPESLWIQQSLTDFTWKVFHAHNGFLQLASEIGIPLTAIAILMSIQQLIEIVYCQYKRQQTGLLFVLGFTIALLISNYSEARMLVTRELYWIFFIALPISMLQQQTMAPADNFVPIPAPLSERTRDKVATHASARTNRQELKARLRSQSVGVTETPTGRIIDVTPDENTN